MWRPELENCPSEHYDPSANRALPTEIVGVIGDVGRIGGQVCRRLAPDEVAVMDAGV